MTHGFQQQAELGFQPPRSAAMPQHGQRPVMKKLLIKEQSAPKPPLPPAHG